MAFRLLATAAGLGAIAVTKANPSVGLTVDLGYSIYQGVLDNVTGLQSWKGIRYAAPPLGMLRWQAPQPPSINRTLVIADTFQSRCPQALNSGSIYPLIPGNEDCLFLNVYVPTTQSNWAGNSDEDQNQSTHAGDMGLPVMVYIHGGGYGVGDGTPDMTTFLNSTGKNMVIVVIQYRLGAFGFLSSEEVRSRGVLNAGLLDIAFALEWVQRYIFKFGGDPDQVTILGDSAGGGASMLLAMAYNGTWGTSRFRRIVAASPYLPTQPYYNDAAATSRYYAFSAAVGCPSSGSVFDCLVSSDPTVLQTVNYNFSNTNPTIPYGNWAFIPVTDGSFVADRPSRQLYSKRVNGQTVLTSNNANEAPAFVPGNITTQADLVRWLKTQFPSLTGASITKLLAAYPSPNVPDDPSSLKFETNGLGLATAVNVSQVATGHQQRAYNMYAESTFACPSYWLASAFIGGGRASYRYQYSVPFAIHSIDWNAIFGPPYLMQGPEFNAAFRLIYRNFIAMGDPSIPRHVANGPSSPNPNGPNPASNWPKWTDSDPMQINLNTSGGTVYVSPSFIGVPVRQFEEPGLLNKFTVADAYSWEGGRGARCAVWRSLGLQIPE